MALELEDEKAKIYEVHLKALLDSLTAKLAAWIAAGTMKKVDSRSAALAISGMMLSQCNLNELLGKLSCSDKSIERLSSEFTQTAVSNGGS